MESSRLIAELLLQIKAIKLNANDPFTWASGKRSPIYCDNRIALSYPYVRTAIKRGLLKAASSFRSFDTIAGVATAGIPHGAILADAMGLPFLYVRSSAKSHGRQNRIEGQLDAGAHTLVVEDLISTGGSSIDAIHCLQEAGAEVVGLLAIFTYHLDESVNNFNELKIPHKTLTNFPTLIDVANNLNLIDQSDLILLRKWQRNPDGWQNN